MPSAIVNFIESRSNFNLWSVVIIFVIMYNNSSVINWMHLNQHCCSSTSKKTKIIVYYCRTWERPFDWLKRYESQFLTFSGYSKFIYFLWFEIQWWRYRGPHFSTLFYRSHEYLHKGRSCYFMFGCFMSGHNTSCSLFKVRRNAIRRNNHDFVCLCSELLLLFLGVTGFMY